MSYLIIDKKLNVKVEVTKVDIHCAKELRNF